MADDRRSYSSHGDFFNYVCLGNRIFVSGRADSDLSGILVDRVLLLQFTRNEGLTPQLGWPGSKSDGFGGPGVRFGAAEAGAYSDLRPLGRQ